MRLIIGILLVMLGASSSALGPSEQDSAKALNLNWIDPSISPKEDFFTYANGTWQKKNPIPADRASWGTFNMLQDKVDKTIHKILIASANDKKAVPGSISQKIGDFYFSGMDEASINKLGIKPLQPEFDRINAIKNLADLQKVISHLQQIGVDALFDFSDMQDFKNSQNMIGTAAQGGLGLPDRDYYLNKGKKFQEIRNAYVQHMTKMFAMLGNSPDRAAAAASTIMTIETTLAKASLTLTELRDPHIIYHMKNLRELDEITPNFSWSQYFSDMGLPALKHINLTTPDFFTVVNQQLQEVPLNDWKTYLSWHLLNSYASYLSQPFVDQDFRMNSVLTGTEKLLPRWKRVVKTANGALGFAIGKLYVEKHFPPESKQAALNILHGIRQAFRQDLQSINWMTEETRKAALKKLDLMEERLGYPSKWRDYSRLKIDRGPYVLNVMRANHFLNKYHLNKIGKPIDRSEWVMTPQTINAYYDPSMNNINIPAGILQPPFFDPAAPAAVNFGAIGLIMGHEMTHGFDDQGSKFDGHGNLKDWWTPTDLKKFQEATDCIAKQFSQYKVDGDIPIQGKLVVGEATADLGGANLAYKAFHESKFYKNAKSIESFTPNQQFFLGFAHMWAINMRPQLERNLATVDPHPPAKFRVNGTLANMPQFQEAFAVPDDCPMVNKNRCVVW
jgi:putative endopeptidase